MQIAQTERLSLRYLVPDDAEFLCRLLNEPSWLQNIGDRGVRTAEDARQYIESKLTPSYRNLGFGMYVAELTVGGDQIGLCGLVQRRTLPGPDLGFALLPQFWGRGHAFEASAAVMRHARTDLALTRLLAIVLPDNRPSVRLLERLGFSQEGTYRLPDDSEELTLYGAAL